MKRSRETYGEGAGLEKMTTAVNDWHEKKGRYEEDVPMPMSRYCALVDIPEETFRKYVCTDPGKRRKLGSQPGPSRLVSKDASQFVVDVMRRKDRADDGMNRRESIDLLQDLQPELTRKQATGAFDKTIRPEHKAVLTGVVKAESTTQKRLAITVPQQTRWHIVRAPRTPRTPHLAPASSSPTHLPQPRLPTDCRSSLRLLAREEHGQDARRQDVWRGDGLLHHRRRRDVSPRE